jgi:hypothetical protein
MRAATLIRRGEFSSNSNKFGVCVQTLREKNSSPLAIDAEIRRCRAHVILGLLPTPVMLYLAAAAGAVVTLWLWRDGKRRAMRRAGLD